MDWQSNRKSKRLSNGVLLGGLMWSTQALGLTCVHTEIDDLLADADVVAVVRTESDVTNRRMNTVAALKGDPRNRYYYEGPLVNPIPNTCCLEIEPKTDYLIVTDESDVISYSWCGEKGIQHVVDYGNGAPPAILLVLYPQVQASRQRVIVEFLRDYWPEVREIWAERFEADYLEKKGASSSTADDFDYRRLWANWNPKTVADDLNSPYLSVYEKERMKAAKFLADFSKRYPPENREPGELLLQRHNSGEVSDFEYEFFRALCTSKPESPYCVIFR